MGATVASPEAGRAGHAAARPWAIVICIVGVVGAISGVALLVAGIPVETVFWVAVGALLLVALLIWPLFAAAESGARRELLSQKDANRGHSSNK
jgi:hypothetical protein